MAHGTCVRVLPVRGQGSRPLLWARRLWLRWGRGRSSAGATSEDPPPHAPVSQCIWGAMVPWGPATGAQVGRQGACCTLDLDLLGPRQGIL